MESATSIAPMSVDIEWWFLCFHYGQCYLLRAEEVLGLAAFGLESLFDLTKCYKFSVHIALSMKHKDPSYSLFWHARHIHERITCPYASEFYYRSDISC